MHRVQRSEAAKFTGCCLNTLYHKLPKDQNGPEKSPKSCQNRQIGKKLPKWQKTPKWLKVLKLGSKGFQGGVRWFQVSNSMGSDDSGDLRTDTLRIRGARSGPEGP